MPCFWLLRGLACHCASGSGCLGSEATWQQQQQQQRANSRKKILLPQKKLKNPLLFLPIPKLLQLQLLHMPHQLLLHLVHQMVLQATTRMLMQHAHPAGMITGDVAMVLLWEKVVEISVPVGTAAAASHTKEHMDQCAKDRMSQIQQEEAVRVKQQKERVAARLKELKVKDTEPSRQQQQQQNRRKKEL